jgi:hypothetical protein
MEKRSELRRRSGLIRVYLLSLHKATLLLRLALVFLRPLLLSLIVSAFYILSFSSLVIQAHAFATLPLCRTAAVSFLTLCVTISISVRLLLLLYYCLYYCILLLICEI